MIKYAAEHLEYQVAKLQALNDLLETYLFFSDDVDMGVVQTTVALIRAEIEHIYNGMYGEKNKL